MFTLNQFDNLSLFKIIFQICFPVYGNYIWVNVPFRHVIPLVFFNRMLLHEYQINTMRAANYNFSINIYKTRNIIAFCRPPLYHRHTIANYCIKTSYYFLLSRQVAKKKIFIFFLLISFSSNIWICYWCRRINNKLGF